MEYNEQHSNGGLHVTSMLVGLAAGVVGTILFATYNRRRFDMATDKVRELSDKSTEYVGGVTENIRHKAGDLVDSATESARNIGSSVKKAVTGSA